MAKYGPISKVNDIHINSLWYNRITNFGRRYSTLLVKRPMAW